MNIKQLEVFVAVATKGSFSAGAEESFITQSTASQHIAALEKELEVKLLERSRDGVSLTKAGKLLMKHARQVLGDLRAAKESIDRFRGVEESSLRIAASTVPGAYLIPPVISQLCAASPHLDITLLQGDSRQAIETVANQEAEIGVVGHRFQERGLTYDPVGNDKICLVVSSGHRFFGKASITLSELAEEPLVAREPGSGTAKTVADALEAAGFDLGSLKTRARLGSNEAVKTAATEGLGAAFLSEFTVRREVERGELGIVAVDGLRITRHFFMVQRANRELGQAASSFRERMLSTYG